jgi:glycerate kinase
MKVLIAIDSMKGSLTSLEAGKAISEGVYRAIADAECIIRPLADGGEGTVEALISGLGGELHKVRVKGPLQNAVEAVYGIVGNTAVIEMASAAGITLIPEIEKNPMVTTTYGVGEIIADAISKGARKFIVGIGGSATNDGGVGMLQALGFKFLDANGEELPFGGAALKNLRSIDQSHVMPEVFECVFKVACDVTNPLLGPAGASFVYGPQKGATPEMVKELDDALGVLASVSKGDASFPGAGAAGGLGYAFKTFLSAELKSGVQLILEETQFEDFVRNADIVVTGEGRLDEQTVMGKAPIGVARTAKKYGKKVIAFSGCVSDGASKVNEHGIDAFFPILRSIVTLEEALDRRNAIKNLTNTAEQVFRCLRLTVP